MKKQEAGFTLIELVVVIVILGLLAATALPRFINVTSDARLANLQGLAAGLRSGVALARAQYVVNGSTTSTTITMDNQNVTVLDEATYPGFGGAPDSTAAGIGVAVPVDAADYAVTYGTGTNVATYQPVSGGSATCQVTYDPDTNPQVVIVSTTC